MLLDTADGSGLCAGRTFWPLAKPRVARQSTEFLSTFWGFSFFFVGKKGQRLPFLHSQVRPPVGGRRRRGRGAGGARVGGGCRAASTCERVAAASPALLLPSGRRAPTHPMRHPGAASVTGAWTGAGKRGRVCGRREQARAGAHEGGSPRRPEGHRHTLFVPAPTLAPALLPDPQCTSPDHSPPACAAAIDAADLQGRPTNQPTARRHPIPQGPLSAVTHLPRSIHSPVFACSCVCAFPTANTRPFFSRFKQRKNNNENHDHHRHRRAPSRHAGQCCRR